MTIYEVKQKAVEALGTVDVTKLTLYDLGSFANTLETLHKIQEDSSAVWKEMIDKLQTSGFNGPEKPTIADLSTKDE